MSDQPTDPSISRSWDAVDSTHPVVGRSEFERLVDGWSELTDHELGDAIVVVLSAEGDLDAVARCLSRHGAVDVVGVLAASVVGVIADPTELEPSRFVDELVELAGLCGPARCVELLDGSSVPSRRIAEAISQLGGQAR